MQCMTARAFGVSVRGATKLWAKISNSIGLGKFQTVYWPHFLYESRMVVLPVPESRKGHFPSFVQREPFEYVKGVVNSEEEVVRTAYKRSKPANHVVSILT